MKKLLTLFLFLFSFSVQYGQTVLTEAVDFTAYDVDGNEWTLFDILEAGQYVCLDFSKADCILSQENAPSVNEAYEYFGCNGFDVVFLGVNSGNTLVEVQFYLAENGIGFPYISGINGNEVLTVYEDYDIGACPTQILIAPDKSILEQDIWSYEGDVVLVPVLENHGLVQNSCLVGINEKREMTISLFPNPADRFINVRLHDQNRIDDTKIEIFNILGKKQKSFEFVSRQMEIDISELDEGLHIMVVTVGSEKVKVKRFVVSR
ncbi:MAG: T9SS type A sorting domain-containing protein [Chlorobi bacterium]|nr:T9SS type A sorting domain-containing protein [Chlorobiota bacterium]